jgi:hypothetical protein
MVEALKDLNSGNATVAIDNILLILEWEISIFGLVYLIKCIVLMSQVLHVIR